jgi:membrane-bound serine protease (ClpP class)
LVGLVLIALEVFVIPGFGLAGISGLIFTIGGLTLIMINNDAFDFSFVPAGEIFAAVLTTLVGMLGAVILMIFGGVGFTESKFFRRVALVDVQDSKQGYTSKSQSRSYLGETGTAFTVLRPSGKVLIGDEVLDAYTRGEFIPEGGKIRVIAEEGTSLKVKKVE